jgi:hypothetical protein
LTFDTSSENFSSEKHKELFVLADSNIVGIRFYSVYVTDKINPTAKVPTTPVLAFTDSVCYQFYFTTSKFDDIFKKYIQDPKELSYNTITTHLITGATKTR